MDTLDVQSQINTISPIAKEHLNGLGKWMRFVAIVLFIFAGLSIISNLVTFSTMGDMLGMMGLPPGAGTAFMVISVLITALQLYIAYLLYQASDGFINYTKTSSVAMLEKAFVKNHTAWLIFGIMTIAFIGLMIFGGIWMASFMSSMVGGFQ